MAILNQKEGLMNNLPDINIQASNGITNFYNAVKSGKGQGTDIFETILSNLNSSLKNGNKSGTAGKSASPLDFLNKTAGKLSGKSSDKSESQDLIFPASFQNQLVAFFNEQGLSSQDISQALSGARNAEGNINISKLLKGLYNGNGQISGQIDNAILMETFRDDFSAYLSNQGAGADLINGLFAKMQNTDSASSMLNAIDSIKSGTEASAENSFINSDQIPAAQSLLFKLGLGAGEIKNITEKCKNSSGGIEIGKLSDELNKLLSADISEDDLVKLFSKNDISVSRDLFKNIETKTDITDKLTSLENLQNTDEIKKNILSLLKEKGVSEEDINSFMKDFDADLIKLKSSNISGAGADVSNSVKNKIAINERQVIAEVLGKDEQEVKTGSWISAKQGIASILEERGVPSKKINNFMSSVENSINKLSLNQDDNAVKSNILNEKVFSFPSLAGDQGDTKLSLADLIKMAEHKANSTQVLKAAAENIQGQAAVKENSYGDKDSKNFSVKESADMSAMNIAAEKSVKNTESVKQANSAFNLPEPLPKIADRMLFMIRNGEQKSRLQITPPNLGKLDIDITVKNGHIQANLSTENVMVKELLEANLNQLKQQLNNHGLTVDKFEVMVGLENGDKNNGNAWAEERNSRGSGSRGGRGIKTAGSEEILSAVSSTISKTGYGNSQIDVHV